MRKSKDFARRIEVDGSNGMKKQRKIDVDLF